MHTGVAMFFMKVGMLQKKCTNGDDMNMHLIFVTMENQKLGKNAFDDEFLVQLMLMSLPQDNTNKNMVTIIILQSTSDTKKLSTTNVTTCLMQEYSHLTSSESTDSVLAACTGNRSKSANKKHCTYKPCCKQGHLKANCQMKKHEKNKQDEGSSKEKDKKGKKTVANIAEDEVTTESASLASVFKSSLPSDDDGDVHVFIASEVITLLSHESSHNFIDSGCSHHLSPCHEYFLDETFTTLKKPIKVHLKGMCQPSRQLERAHCAISWTLPRALSLPSLLMLCMFQSSLLHSSHSLASPMKTNTTSLLKMLVVLL